MGLQSDCNLQVLKGTLKKFIGEESCNHEQINIMVLFYLLINYIYWFNNC